ncbi:N-acetylneuraminate synthase family protein [Sansalvadorimonas sp. 2012CJ34-2]|uniref:N-acetylneuraminate synthase family protein n=1 Tax=Parendozoicomonas callyspongiae TaxID=2942213 RepID=A0ABT0PKX1_9GAMM|nr:N-acetylneuraminate synthase family protein [Sansalvadorimonas sp. 2012CJ34-2]MCL6272035.1 N-acetylneuraminate synthase family protein [Sansalvadorimonas sp. 2012CJ34-2]
MSTTCKILAKDAKPYVIAEIGANHNGDMDLARKLIDQAKEAGADCVKFQSWTKDSVFCRKKYEDNYFLGDDYRDRNDYTLEEIVEAYSVSESELIMLKAYCDEVGIDFSSTPFSREEADFLVDTLDAPFVKVASMDLNNYPFLDYLARKGKPIIISTGFSDLNEIDKAISTIEKAGNKDIVILHCVSSYPPCDCDVNLNNIKTLMSIYPEYNIGFSDHTIGIEIPLAAVALGARVVEKHFTLDKEMEGWDHKVSANYAEMSAITNGAKRIQDALGSKRIVATETQEKKVEFRRSLVLKRKMKSGEVISINDIGFKRPGTGLKPEMVEFVVGLKINKDLEYDHIIRKEDLM